MKTKENDWLRCKSYLHIDKPFSSRDAGKIRHCVTNPSWVAKHAFLPLIRRAVVSYPYRENADGIKAPKRKRRNLTYASHIDAAVFGYYAYLLQEKYESYLKVNGLCDVVTAYRKIPDNKDGKKGNKCNIHFARDVFEYIKSNVKPGAPLTVITFDIKGFFDNLDHSILKSRWKEILDVNSLTDDWWSVYKHTIRYSYVREKDLYSIFKDCIYCRSKSGLIGQKKIKNWRFLRANNAVAYCDGGKDIEKIRKAGLIKTRGKGECYGIPQGLPISAVLANVYMSHFDRDVNELLVGHSGIYRRYSDDIIVVLPSSSDGSVKETIINRIKEEKLEIEERKTNVYEFERTESGIRCTHIGKDDNKVLEYLGFSFDGNRVLLKPASVCKFYYKMHRSVRRGTLYACMVSTKNPTFGVLYKYRLIKRYTGAGSKRHRIYVRDKKSKTFHLLNGIRTYGNYLTYVAKSKDLMGEKYIEHQLSRCTNRLSQQIKKAEVNIEKYCDEKRKRFGLLGK